ncbi:MAG: hypothetical protein ABI378_04605 [Chitinophagaceae bacterium]
MKATLLTLSILITCIFFANAQISFALLKPFFNGLNLVDTSGSGLNERSGDILLELKDTSNPDGKETLVILRNNNGKLSKVASNVNLLRSKDLLGVSGGNYPSLSEGLLSVDYTTGSNSSQSDVSIEFERNNDGNYYFKTYTSVTRNYGVENLFARVEITTQQTGKINFSEATEEMILKKVNASATLNDKQETLYKATSIYAKYIPDGWRLGAYATGDLNWDVNKTDLLLLLYNEEVCRIQLLLQQNDGLYRKSVANDNIIIVNDYFNINNLKAIIKNGYFTIEERWVTVDKDFDHRYITFKYEPATKTWNLHRYDVEHYSGFNPKPMKEVKHLTKTNFGIISFEKLQKLPGE